MPVGRLVVGLHVAVESWISDHIWSIEQLCELLSETRTIGSRIDRGLILKALGA